MDGSPDPSEELMVLRAELAVAHARAADDKASIAHQALRYVKAPRLAAGRLNWGFLLRPKWGILLRQKWGDLSRH